MNQDLRQYLDDGEHLPDFMKDFHDQKDLFKSIYDQYRNGNASKLLSDVNWVDAHCFTIDIFLWWMACHGYKLQRIRKSGITFSDPEQTVKEFTDLRMGKISSIIKDKEEQSNG